MKEYEPPKVINKYQALIDSCSFLMNYCKDLYPSESDQVKKEKTENVDVESAMKSGEWSKMKGVEVIVSKKKKNLDTKKDKPKEQPAKPEAEDDKFNHSYFVEQAFEKVHVLPPTKVD